MQYLNKLDELIKQILEASDDVLDSNTPEEDEELEEISVTGGMDGGEGPPRTPYAFSGKKKEDEEKKRKNATTSTGYTLVGEIYDSNYQNYKKDETLNSRQKVNGSIKEISKRLMQIERILNRNIKLKKESGVNSGHYWKSTKQTMGKVSERLIRVAQRLRELSS
jgi:hypothetical protein